MIRIFFYCVKTQCASNFKNEGQNWNTCMRSTIFKAMPTYINDFFLQFTKYLYSSLI